MQIWIEYFLVEISEHIHRNNHWSTRRKQLVLIVLINLVNCLKWPDISDSSSHHDFHDCWYLPPTRLPAGGYMTVYLTGMGNPFVRMSENWTTPGYEKVQERTTRGSLRRRHRLFKGSAMHGTVGLIPFSKRGTTSFCSILNCLTWRVLPFPAQYRSVLDKGWPQWCKLWCVN